jgi:Fe-S-cluster containining protein
LRFAFHGEPDVSRPRRQDAGVAAGWKPALRALHQSFKLHANLMTTPKPTYDCLKCPAYCCSYERIIVENKDLRRLAKHFDIDVETARRRFTKVREGEQVLRHPKDKIYGSVCMFLDTRTRRCTIYDARPGVCHEYPDKPRCGYYDFLRWERTHQEDEQFIPLKMG